ncbi:MAG TPA: rhomboid family intramembrane serine protease [Acidimicrobiia bacterium]
MTQDHTTAAPVCYRHPDRHTLLRCSRCERPICASCSIDASVGQRCPECIKEEGTQRVIPTGSKRTRTSGAPATTTFVALAVIFFVLTGFGRNLVDSSIGRALAQVNFLVEAGEWWRIFTPILLHASFMHILFNMWALWVLGPQIERGVGTWPFVGAYLASAGMGGAFAYLMGSPADIAVGASGAIFGLFGIWFNFAVRRRNTMQGRYLLRQIGFLLVLNAALPFIVGGIAWEAHLGGLIAGFVIGELWSRVPRKDALAGRLAVTIAIGALGILAVLVLPVGAM